MGNLAIITDGSLVRKTDYVTAVLSFGVSYKDGNNIERTLTGQEIDQERFLEIQATARRKPTTSAPSFGLFLDQFDQALAQGCREFLVLTISPKFSSTFEYANTAAVWFKEAHPEVEIYVLDTGTTAGGVAWLAENAHQLYQQGETFAHIIHRLEDLKGKIELFLATDTLAYLADSGRVAALGQKHRVDTLKKYARWATAKTAAIHKLKLVLRLEQGEEHVLACNKFYPSAVDRMIREIEERDLARKIRRIYVHQSRSEEEARKLAFRINYDREGPLVEIVEETEIPLALLAVTGPKLVAAVCIYA